MAKPTTLLFFFLALLLSRCAEQPLPLPAEPLSESPHLDSTTFLRNAAVAYFNQGVAARESAIQQSFGGTNAGLEAGAPPPEKVDESQFCPYFTRAQAINALLPDTLQLWYIRDAAKACPATPSAPGGDGAGGGVAPAAQDFALRGQMMDAATRGYLPRAAYERAVITAKGLPYGYLLSRGQFRVDVPGGWSSPVTLSVTVPGYVPVTMVVQPQDFGKAVVVPLTAQPKCYEILRAEGIALMGEKKYEAASAKFSAAAQCFDVPSDYQADLADLMYQNARLDLSKRDEEQSRLERTRDSLTQRLANLRAQADDDSDGIPNATDLCPKIKGTPTNQGCPAGDLYRQHTVQDGESLRAIAIQYNMDLQELAVANGMDANDRPLPGKIVLIPVASVSPPTGAGVAAILVAEIEKNMVAAPGGAFQMGCEGEHYDDCQDGETPLRTVRLDGFSISKYEVTQAQWRAVMGSNPSYNAGCDNCPVERISWDDAQEFIQKLNGLTKKVYRLPTEAEWEYAARGGNKSRKYRYSGSYEVNKVAWYIGNHSAGNTFGSKKTTRPVGSKEPNELGLYDMSGNVLEWCSDWYDAEYYADKTAALSNPQGPKKGDFRVVRGGSWNHSNIDCWAARRFRYLSEYRITNCGLRLAR